MLFVFDESNIEKARFFFSYFFSAAFVGHTIVFGLFVLVASIVFNLFSFSFLGMYGTFILGLTALSIANLMFVVNFYNVFVLGISSAVTLSK